MFDARAKYFSLRNGEKLVAEKQRTVANKPESAIIVDHNYDHIYLNR